VSFAPIESIVDAIRSGGMVIMVDDEDRENEGDLIIAAESATPEQVGFMLRHTSGIICLPVIGERLDPTDADLASEASLYDWLRREATTFSHICGTCKMGLASDPMAVVDQYGQVHGLEGLYVADASIMPDLVRAPINPTVIMMAERLADLVQQGH